MRAARISSRCSGEIGPLEYLPIEVQELHRAHPAFVNLSGPQLPDQSDDVTMAQIRMGPAKALATLRIAGTLVPKLSRSLFR